jgi:CRP/FNR family cyclic AMP-dependent transcriptional regulator
MTRTQTAQRSASGPRSYPAGKLIFKEGESGSTMYVVLSGEVDLRIKGRIIETVRKGGVLGEMALLNGGPRTATAVARNGCTLTPIDKTEFSDLVGRSPDFSLQIMQTIANRLRRMDKRYQMPAVSADAPRKKPAMRVRKPVK